MRCQSQSFLLVLGLSVCLNLRAQEKAPTILQPLPPPDGPFVQSMRGLATNWLQDDKNKPSPAQACAPEFLDKLKITIDAVRQEISSVVFYYGGRPTHFPEGFSNPSVTVERVLSSEIFGDSDKSIAGCSSDNRIAYTKAKAPKDVIVICAPFYLMNPEEKPATLVHEALHRVTGLSDIDLRSRLSLPAQPLSKGTHDITLYLKEGCPARSRDSKSSGR